MNDAEARQTKDAINYLSIFVEERRYFVSKLFQAVAIYLALLGFAIREMIEVHSFGTTILVGCILTMIQICAAYVGFLFISIINSLSQKIVLADPTCELENKRLRSGIRIVYPMLIIMQVVIVGVFAMGVRR
jgi:hypothetical protein